MRRLVVALPAKTDEHHVAVDGDDGNLAFNSWTLPVTVSDDDFVGLDERQALAPQLTDGSLPPMTLVHLALRVRRLACFALCVAAWACSQEQTSDAATSQGPSAGVFASGGAGAGMAGPDAPTGAGTAAAAGNAAGIGGSGGGGESTPPASSGAGGDAGGEPAMDGRDASIGMDAASMQSAPDPDDPYALFIAPDGSDDDPGTRALPLATLPEALQRAAPGWTIWLEAGTYAYAETIRLTAVGDDARPIRIFAVEGQRPVIDFSAQTPGDSSARGLQISGSYFHLRGFDVIKAGDNCIHISGSHNTIEHVATHGCSDTGLQITANGSEAGDPSRAAYNTVLNCDSYENYDAANQGENADGFAAKLYIGPGNVFRGCRAWNNADDGWDLFASDDVVVIEDCWAIANGKIGPGQDNTNGDGNGFKLGGAARVGDLNMGGAVHEVRNCISLDNAACGFTRNNNTSTPELSMCGGSGDGRGTFCSLTSSNELDVHVTAAEVLAAQRDDAGNLPPL